jgi:predicted phage terminase large subunit-like protein
VQYRFGSQYSRIWGSWLLEVGGSESEAAALARRGKRDLFFLMKVILGEVYPDVQEHTHKRFCDFFVQKNTSKKFELQDLVKNRLLMAPRGHYKTSTHLVDCISWMLNFPNVTILLLSGSQDVASRMVEEVKQIFLTCTTFRELYPECIPTENVREFGAKGEFWLPRKARTRIRREPNLSISTLESVKASTHYDLRCGDDVVTELNSKSNLSAKIDQNDKVTSDWNATKPLLNPGGYTQIIGTFYNWSCMYGNILDRLGLSEHMRFGFPLEDVRKGWKVAIYPAIRPDEQGTLFNKSGILFPEKFCINSDTPEEQAANADKFNLQEAFEEDPENFFSQYMNHPKSSSQDYFPLELLRKQTIHPRDVPMTASVFASWDLAFTANRKSDFTVGAVGAYDMMGNIYIIDIFRGRWNPYQIVDKIIECWRKWPLQREGIEGISGSPLLMPGLTARMRDLGLMIPIDWIQVKRRSQSVVNEILSLSTLLQQGKLFFVNTLPHLQELYVEFSRYGKYSNDDICRAVSLLLFYLGKGQQMTVQAQDPPEIGGATTYGDGECGAGIVA